MSNEAPDFGLVEGEGSERKLENIDAYVDEGVEQALTLVKERFEEAPESRNNLDFHNVAHTEGVMRRTESVLTAIQQADPTLVSEREVVLGRLAAAYHDTVQRWEPNTVVDGDLTKVTRRRFVGENEKTSAGEVMAFMDEINGRGQVIFSDDDRQVVQEAIAATIPGWDPTNKTVQQPKLTAESPLIARAVALADIGVAGVEGPKAYISEGNALFREENLDIRAAINEHGMENIPVNQKEYFRARMVAWQKGQIEFARGRQLRLEIELAAIPEPARYSVRQLFNRFDQTIAAQEELAMQAENMNFEDLTRLMAY